jgi:hypothetical protein
MMSLSSGRPVTSDTVLRCANRKPSSGSGVPRPAWLSTPLVMSVGAVAEANTLSEIDPTSIPKGSRALAAAVALPKLPEVMAVAVATPLVGAVPATADAIASPVDRLWARATEVASPPTSSPPPPKAIASAEAVWSLMARAVELAAPPSLPKPPAAKSWTSTTLLPNASPRELLVAAPPRPRGLGGITMPPVFEPALPP